MIAKSGLLRIRTRDHACEEQSVSRLTLMQSISLQSEKTGGRAIQIQTASRSALICASNSLIENGRPKISI